MKLTHRRLLGRYQRPDGCAVNVHKAREVGTGYDVLFYLYRGRRVVIGENDFYGKWKKTN